jgi:pimeloyl-ACP methyl ester carboxylesterase
VSGIYKSQAGKDAVENFYRSILQRWPVANQQLHIATRHGTTFVVACGPLDGPPLVLLHGSGSNAAIWMRDAAAWAERYRVYAVDIIGEPGLSAPARPPLDSGAYVEWLDDLWDGLRIASASIVAVSLGAALALEYAVKRPPRVLSLSLLSPAGITPRRPLFIWKAALMLLFGKRGVRRAFAAAAGKDQLPPPVVRYMTLIFENFRPRREAPPVRTDRELAALSMPVQVVLGAKDAMLDSARTRDRLRRLVGHADIAWVEEAGHLLPPQTMRVADFLGQLT